MVEVTVTKQTHVHYTITTVFLLPLFCRLHHDEDSANLGVCEKNLELLVALVDCPRDRGNLELICQKKNNNNNNKQTNSNGVLCNKH
jgi:hypothetical protein